MVAHSDVMNHPQFDAILDDVMQIALKAMPKHRERILKAAVLVVQNKVALDSEHNDGEHFLVQGSEDGVVYHVNASCECPDFKNRHKEIEGKCKHRLSARLLQRTMERLTALDATPPPCAEPCPAPVKIKPQYIVMIQEKRFVKFDGLLDYAHRLGLQSLTVEVISITADQAIFSATAVMNDGRTFSDIGDATINNVTKKVAPHFIRCASTRAKARALRNACNVDMVALEELGENIDTE